MLRTRCRQESASRQYLYNVDQGFIFGSGSTSSEFYITPNKEYDGTIYDVTWTLKRDADNVTLINKESYKIYEQTRSLEEVMLAEADSYLKKCYNVNGTVSNPLESPYGMMLKTIVSTHLKQPKRLTQIVPLWFVYVVHMREYLYAIFKLAIIH